MAQSVAKPAVRVLIVDDEDFNFVLFQRALSCGFDLEFACCGRDCLDRAIENPPDVIVLDLCMPGLDGYDTCRILKNTPETKHIPVFIISGLEGNGVRDAAFQAGCDAFYCKPLPMNEIADKLRQQH